MSEFNILTCIDTDVGTDCTEVATSSYLHNFTPPTTITAHKFTTSRKQEAETFLEISKKCTLTSFNLVAVYYFHQAYQMTFAY